MMNQQYSLPGRTDRRLGCYDRSPFRSRTMRGSMPGGGLGGSGCGCGSNRLPTNRDMRPDNDRDKLPCASRQAEPKYDRQEEVANRRNGCLSQSSPSDTGGRSSKCMSKSAGCHDCEAHKLMDQIRAVDFALYEVVLYLDVYPHSCDALETYHKLKAQREELHHMYETHFGPLTAFGNESPSGWDWMKKPFPWEYSAE